jgi:hypothetical protein|tara:strand:- start:1241 stop:1864 length:624 start_codon:yes stop_codon:yes gene_type:complete
LVLSYAITVCNEHVEIQKLVTFLLDNKREQDEIVITFDSRNGSKSVEDYLRTKSVNGEFNWHPFDFSGNFSDLKNYTKSMCSGDYIFHLDADEIPHETLMEQLPQILDINNVDLIWLPRVNTVDGITEEHIQKWGWKVSEKGWVNYPDYQARVFRNTEEIKWIKSVHEIISGASNFSHLPPYEELSLIHHKTIQKQEKQNKLYEELM